MKRLLEDLLGHRPAMIGMVHTRPLPGSPGYDRAAGMRAVLAHARIEARTLVEAGFHALLFCNEADMPYRTSLGAETVAAMTAVVGAVMADHETPFGLNMLLDPAASIAIAHATGGRFVRAFLTGAYVGDLGLFVPDAAAALRLRASLGAEAVKILANVTPGFAAGLDTRSVEERASGAVLLGLADAVVVGGPAAGAETDGSVLARVAARLPDTPVVVGTGAAAGNVAALSATADAFIVGSSIKEEGRLLAPVDPVRAAAFMAAARSSPDPQIRGSALP